MKPTDVVARWVELFNAADADGLAELYAEDAINHQVVTDPVEGREAIKEMLRGEFAKAEMNCIPEAIHDAGDTAILEWIDPAGLRGCGFFTVKEGLITFQRGYWDKLSFLRLHGDDGRARPSPGRSESHEPAAVAPLRSSTPTRRAREVR